MARGATAIAVVPVKRSCILPITKKSAGGETLKTIDEERVMWTKPEFVDLRVGFEVTMYFSVR